MANYQRSLEGKLLKPEPTDSEHPWRGICSYNCWMAKNPECFCRCGGLHHGKGRKRKEVEKAEATG